MSWFDCKITYEKELLDRAQIRKVSENYLVDAESFTDAETRIAKEMSGRGAFVIDSVKKICLYEFFLDHESKRYYKAKVGFITLDERTSVEKKKYVQMLVQADDIELALEYINKGMADTLSDYEVASLAETNIVGIYPYDLNTVN